MQFIQMYNWFIMCVWVWFKIFVKSRLLERIGFYEFWDLGNFKKMIDIVKSRDDWGRGVVIGVIVKVNQM